MIFLFKLYYLIVICPHPPLPPFWPNHNPQRSIFEQTWIFPTWGCFHTSFSFSGESVYHMKNFKHVSLYIPMISQILDISKLLISRYQTAAPYSLSIVFFTLDTSMCIFQRYVINTSTWSFKWPQASEAWRVWQDVNSGDTCITCLVIIDLWLRILLPNL